MKSRDAFETRVHCASSPSRRTTSSANPRGSSVPGMKPAAATQDLARFWGAGYKDMAKDMHGRYPKHDWPDDPANARAHEERTKKRL